MGLFYYDSETSTGIYLSDKDMEYASTALGWTFGALGALVIFYWVLAAVLLVILSPFIMLFFLDDLVDIFVSNYVVFVAIAALVTALKLCKKTAGRWIVRFLFDIFVFVSAVCVLLYVLHFSDPINAILQTINDYLLEDAEVSFASLIGEESLGNIASGNWFYSVFSSCADWVYGSGSAILEIAFVVVSVILFIVLTIVPYAFALLSLVFLNKIIFRFNCKKVLAVRKNKKYEEAAQIDRQELDRVMNNPGYYGQAKIFEIYERIAKAGNPVAQVCCAQCYNYGEGVAKNDQKTFYWYHQAALQGNTKGQLMTAIFYLNGIGVKKDKLLAKAWLRVALRDREFIDRNRTKQTVSEMLTTVAKKTRFMEYL